MDKKLPHILLLSSGFYLLFKKLTSIKIYSNPSNINKDIINQCPSLSKKQYFPTPYL